MSGSVWSASLADCILLKTSIFMVTDDLRCIPSGNHGLLDNQLQMSVYFSPFKDAKVLNRTIDSRMVLVPGWFGQSIQLV